MDTKQLTNIGGITYNRSMKLEKPENENYAAVVVQIDNLVPLVADSGFKKDCDNVLGAPLLGYQAIVSKETKQGDIGILFVAETQLSEDYIKNNNLSRKPELNKDGSKVGYIEQNRRIRAIKFRGHTSNALFMPLSSLKYTKAKVDKLEVGDTFDKINDQEVCKKYVVPRKLNTRLEKNKDKEFKRVDQKFLPEHYDSDQYFRNKDAIPQDREVIITQKIHGTSIRIGNTIVKRKLSLYEKAAKRLGLKIQETEFDYVYGSRKAIKDINNPRSQHFYETDIWTEKGKEFNDLVPENFILYGELIGWAGENTPIQKNYTYKIAPGQSELYVYRVAIVTNQGQLVDLSWDQLKEFCSDRGIKYVPELWRGKHSELDPEEWTDKKYFEEGFSQAIELDDSSPCDEGVCVRVDGLAPYILKIKSPIFYEHETKAIDQGVVDIEEEQKQEA